MRKKRLVKSYKSSRSINSISQLNQRKGKSNFIFSIFGVSIILLLTILNILTVDSEESPKVVQVLASSKDIEHERNFWNEILVKTPDYLPGILELAKIEYETGNLIKSKELFAKARAINPNNDEVQKNRNLMSSIERQ